MYTVLNFLYKPRNIRVIAEVDYNLVQDEYQIELLSLQAYLPTGEVTSPSFVSLSTLLRELALKIESDTVITDTECYGMSVLDPWGLYEGAEYVN